MRSAEATEGMLAAVARAGGDAVIEVYRANRGTLGKIREVETMIKRRQKER